MERLWSNLTSIKTFHCQLSSSQTHPGHSRNSQQPSHDLVSVLCSLVSCILAQSLSFLGHHYSSVLRHLHNTTWLARQHSGAWNENGIGPSPDNFSLRGKKGLGTRLLLFKTVGCFSQVNLCLKIIKMAGLAGGKDQQVTRLMRRVMRLPHLTVLSLSLRNGSAYCCRSQEADNRTECPSQHPHTRASLLWPHLPEY